MTQYKYKINKKKRECDVKTISEKCKITKILNSKKNSKRKVSIKCQYQMIKHVIRMDNNCNIPDLVQTFSNVENGGLNLVL